MFSLLDTSGQFVTQMHSYHMLQYMFLGALPFLIFSLKYNLYDIILYVVLKGAYKMLSITIYAIDCLFYMNFEMEHAQKDTSGLSYLSHMI